MSIMVWINAPAGAAAPVPQKVQPVYRNQPARQGEQSDSQNQSKLLQQLYTVPITLYRNVGLHGTILWSLEP
jgi:hypothetical protein